MKDIIKAIKCSFDYVIKDENDKIESVTHALSDFDLNIEEGSFVCILGHNGSGKSTFARLINGLNLPTGGEVYVTDLSTLIEENLLPVRMACGMVFQNPDNQIIANVVEEDVAFGPENTGVPSEEIVKRVDTALRDVSMEEYRTKSPNRLSGGQKQRVAIAGVMAMKPKCIVLDEPTAMLDPLGRKDVIATVHKLNKEEGITIVLITHYMEEACGADRVIVMDHGHTVKDGTPAQVFEDVLGLKALSLRVPEITELAYELRKAGLPLPKVILTEEELKEALIEIKRKQECLEK